MQVTQQEIDNLTPINNWVVLKTKRKVVGTNLIKHGGLTIDGSHNVGMHAPVVCEVIKCPKEITALAFTEQWWDTEMELEVGDTVVVNYMAITKALAMDAPGLTNFVYTEENGEREYYLWVKYSNIYAAKRGEQVIPLNGFILCRPLEEKKEMYGLELPEHLKQASSRYCEVAHVGKPNKAYLDYRFIDFDDQAVEINEGDIINFDRSFDLSLEYDLYNDIFSERLYRIQRLNILGVLDEQFQEV